HYLNSIRGQERKKIQDDLEEDFRAVDHSREACSSPTFRQRLLYVNTKYKIFTT
ncbi:hypothetical protein L9F63_027260, partial [Diploptera punctata]